LTIDGLALSKSKKTLPGREYLFHAKAQIMRGLRKYLMKSEAATETALTRAFVLRALPRGDAPSLHLASACHRSTNGAIGRPAAERPMAAFQLA
jgi:hypothetical protein